MKLRERHRHIADIFGHSITLIGAGNMGQALARGWLKAKSKPALTVVDPEPSAIVQNWADTGQLALNPDPRPADTLVIAVKPQVFCPLAASLSQWAGPETLVISVMAGITMETLSKRLGTPRVIRVIPNTPGLIGKGVTLLSAPRDADGEDIKMATRLLKPLGIVEGPIPEDKLAAGMAISSCSPAYVYFLTEMMAACGESEGLDPDLSARIARQAVVGAAALMARSDETPQVLRRAVTSPGGTTQAALDVLMNEGGLPFVMRKAVKAVIRRDRELSRDN